MLYSIGYQNFDTVEELIGHLKAHQIEVIVDVRSKPYSWNAAFRKKNLKQSLSENGISYRWLGRTLGGFQEISESAINHLIKLQTNKKVCIMCMEADPDRCHRKMVIADRLEHYGVTVTHIEA